MSTSRASDFASQPLAASATASTVTAEPRALEAQHGTFGPSGLAATEDLRCAANAGTPALLGKPDSAMPSSASSRTPAESNHISFGDGVEPAKEAIKPGLAAEVGDMAGASSAAVTDTADTLRTIAVSAAATTLHAVEYASSVAYHALAEPVMHAGAKGLEAVEGMAEGLLDYLPSPDLDAATPATPTSVRGGVGAPDAAKAEACAPAIAKKQTGATTDAGQVVEAVSTTTTHAVDTVKEGATQAAQASSEVIATTAQAAQDLAARAAVQAKETLAWAGEQAKESAVRAAETTKDVAVSAKDTAVSLGGQAMEAAAQTADHVANTAGHAYVQATSAAQQAAQDGYAQAQRAIETAVGASPAPTKERKDQPELQSQDQHKSTLDSYPLRDENSVNMAAQVAAEARAQKLERIAAKDPADQPGSEWSRVPGEAHGAPFERPAAATSPVGQSTAGAGGVASEQPPPAKLFMSGGEQTFDWMAAAGKRTAEE